MSITNQGDQIVYKRALPLPPKAVSSSPHHTHSSEHSQKPSKPNINMPSVATTIKVPKAEAKNSYCVVM